MSDPVAAVQQTSEIISALSSLFQALDEFIPRLISTSAIIAAIFPMPANKGSLLGKIHAFVNVAACNFKHATNKTNMDDPE